MASSSAALPSTSSNSDRPGPEVYPLASYDKDVTKVEGSPLPFHNIPFSFPTTILVDEEYDNAFVSDAGGSLFRLSLKSDDCDLMTWHPLRTQGLENFDERIRKLYETVPIYPFADIRGLQWDMEGNLYISDADNHCVWIFFEDGTYCEIAGNGGGFQDGHLSEALLRSPMGLVYDPSQDGLYIADSKNHCIRFLQDDMMYTLAGCGTVAGIQDGYSAEALFNEPQGMVMHPDGYLIVADCKNNRIRKVTLDGDVTTIAFSGEKSLKDGHVSEAACNAPTSVAVDSQGNIYVADSGNGAIRKISPDGYVTTLLHGPKDANLPGCRKIGMVNGIQVAEKLGYLLFTEAAGHSIRAIKL